MCTNQNDPAKTWTDQTTRNVTNNKTTNRCSPIVLLCVFCFEPLCLSCPAFYIANHIGVTAILNRTLSTLQPIKQRTRWTLRKSIHHRKTVGMACIHQHIVPSFFFFLFFFQNKILFSGCKIIIQLFCSFFFPTTTQCWDCANAPHLIVRFLSEGASFCQSSFTTSGLSKHDHARSALDDGLGVGEDGGDVHATGALDVHEVGVGGLHKAFEFVGGGLTGGGWVQ